MKAALTIERLMRLIQDNVMDLADTDDAPLALRDILVDLRHVCDVHGLDFAQLDERADELYQGES